MKSLFNIGLLDGSALAWFIACWIGYTWFAEWHARRATSLVSARRALTRQWMHNIIVRENRILDSTILNNLLHGATFFASTTIVVLGGLFALLGTSETAMSFVSELPFGTRASTRVWEIKTMLMLVLFVYAFFKFTWSMRQYNFVSIMVGAMPEDRSNPEQHRDYIERTATVATYAGENFNTGLRAYYFGVAAMTWLLNPWLMVVAAVFVMVVLYRREFHSPTLRAMVAKANG